MLSLIQSLYEAMFQGKNCITALVVLAVFSAGLILIEYLVCKKAKNFTKAYDKEVRISIAAHFIFALFILLVGKKSIIEYGFLQTFDLNFVFYLIFLGATAIIILIISSIRRNYGLYKAFALVLIIALLLETITLMCYVGFKMYLSFFGKELMLICGLLLGFPVVFIISAVCTLLGKKIK